MSTVQAACGLVFAGLLAAASPATATPGHHDRAWVLGHLDAAGLAKCKAFKQVRLQTAAMQRAGGGTITAGERHRLESQLHRVRQMPPSSLTAMACGVPL